MLEKGHLTLRAELHKPWRVTLAGRKIDLCVLEWHTLLSKREEHLWESHTMNSLNLL